LTIHLDDPGEGDEREQNAKQRQQQHGAGGEGESPRSAPPNASEPVSPMKMRAGDAFHHEEAEAAAAAAGAD
jgi:hypothetical protein